MHSRLLSSASNENSALMPALSLWSQSRGPWRGPSKENWEALLFAISNDIPSRQVLVKHRIEIKRNSVKHMYSIWFFLDLIGSYGGLDWFIWHWTICSNIWMQVDACNTTSRGPVQIWGLGIPGMNYVIFLCSVSTWECCWAPNTLWRSCTSFVSPLKRPRSFLSVHQMLGISDFFRVSLLSWVTSCWLLCRNQSLAPEVLREIQEMSASLSQEVKNQWPFCWRSWLPLQGLQWNGTTGRTGSWIQRGEAATAIGIVLRHAETVSKGNSVWCWLRAQTQAGIFLNDLHVLLERIDILPGPQPNKTTNVDGCWMDTWDSP